MRRLSWPSWLTAGFVALSGGLSIMLALSFTAPAAAQSGAAPARQGTGCDQRAFNDGYYIRDGRRVFDDEKYNALALRLNTPVFLEAEGEALAPRALQFSERVNIIDPGNGKDRIRVQDARAQPLGWVARDSVLCRISPISDQDETGLYKRVVVRTDTAVQGQIQPKRLYQTPASLPPDQRCEGGVDRCATVSRFQWYFIYAEENDHYLISDGANLGSSATGRLMGWLPKADGYIWNTALGIRPREELASASPEKFVCAYKTPEDLRRNAGRSIEDLARAANKPALEFAQSVGCNPVLGGKRWFGLEVRMAVLNETPQAYEVLFSNAGTAGQDLASGGFEGFNRLDVFFVIDGTKSMQQAIEAVKDLTAKAEDHLRKKLAQGGILRFGFRIYRDSNQKSRLDGVSNSEFLALPRDAAKCNISNTKEFRAAIDKVKAEDTQEDDDFEENSFGALVQASEDAAGCPDNTKMIFVVGDAGYSAQKQQSRGFTAWSEAQVANRWRAAEQGARFRRPPLMFFIETPRQASGIANKPQYDAAYDAFKSQSGSLLSAIYKGTSLERSAGGFFIPPQQASDASQAGVIANTLSRIDGQLNTDAMRQVAQGIQSGQSLSQIIERLQNNSQLNIPTYFLQYVEESLCRRLGNQCRTQVLEAVNRAFVPNDANVVPEVLLSEAQLGKWLSILSVFKDFSGSVAGQDGRNRLINTALTNLGNILQIDLQSDRVSLSKRAQFSAGLPNGARSKLMQYSDDDLRSLERTPSCEIEFLKQYAVKKFEILNIVKGLLGNARPRFSETRWPEDACRNLSDKGKKVPYIDSAVEPVNLNANAQETLYSMRHKKVGLNEQFYWVPVDYLP